MSRFDVLLKGSEAANARLTGIDQQQHQHLDALKREGLQRSLINLIEVLANLRTYQDQWRQEERDARSKAGEKGKFDPVYTEQRDKLQERYRNLLAPSAQEAKFAIEQVRHLAPELNIGEIDDGSRIGRALSGEAYPIENLGSLIGEVNSYLRKLSAILTDPE
jgi:hypothetical protein